jgi:hypothetical protein
MLRFNFIVMGVLLAAVAHAAERAYVIHFDEADHKGDRTSFERVSATMVHNATKLDTQDEPTESETTIGMRLLGDWEVLDVEEAAANSTAESVIIRSWTRKLEHDGNVISEDKPVLPPGTKVIARLRDDETKYTIRNPDDDEETDPPREVKSLLSGVMALHKSSGHTRDSAMFGGTKPRKVGESWPVDADAAARIYRENLMDVRPQDIGGTVKLLDVQTYNGRECLHVAADVNIASFRPLSATKPAQDRDGDDDYQVKSSSMTSRVEWLIDAAGDEKHYASFSTVRKSHGEGKTPDGKHYAVDQTLRQETRIRRLAGGHTGAATNATTRR